jgi:N-acetylneuraminic acid mutarotase
MKSCIFFLTAFFAFTTTVHGSFDVPDLPAMYGMISAQLDNSLYLFGGQDHASTYYNDLYKLTLIDSTYKWETLPQKNAPDGTIYGQGYITFDNKSMVIMGGFTFSNQYKI